MIRPFEMRDKKQIRRLFFQENKYHHNLVPDYVNQLTEKNIMNTRWLKGVYESPEREILVDERKGVLVGLLMFTEGLLDDSVFAFSRYIHVNELVVDEGWRSKGIGRELMTYLENYASDIGVEAIRLEVWQANEDARAFYNKLNYDVTKEVRFKRL